MSLLLHNKNKIIIKRITHKRSVSSYSVISKLVKSKIHSKLFNKIHSNPILSVINLVIKEKIHSKEIIIAVKIVLIIVLLKMMLIKIRIKFIKTIISSNNTHCLANIIKEASLYSKSNSQIYKKKKIYN